MGPASSGDYTAFRSAAAVRQFGNDRSTSGRVVDGIETSHGTVRWSAYTAITTKPWLLECDLHGQGCTELDRGRKLVRLRDAIMLRPSRA
jgi:hypothetical protein